MPTLPDVQIPEGVVRVINPQTEQEIVDQTNLIKQVFSGVTVFLAGVTLGTVLSRVVRRRPQPSGQSRSF